MPRILVVDDELQVRELLRKILVRAGYVVHTAGNVESALEMCAPPAVFDLVISDVVMPGEDGHKLARRLAARCPNGRVILMSGFDPGCDECPYRDGCRMLSKPFLPQEVVKLVADVLAQPSQPVKSGGEGSGEGSSGPG